MLFKMLRKMMFVPTLFLIVFTLNSKAPECLGDGISNEPEGNEEIILRHRKTKCAIDADCLEKSTPTCCGTTLEFFQDCWHKKDAPPKKLDCVSNRVCVDRMARVKCVCSLNKKCATYYKF